MLQLVASRLRAAALLAIIYSTMPFAVLYTCVCTILHFLRHHRKRPSAPTHHIALVTGGKMSKALEVCRTLHQAGVRTILVEEAKYRCAARLSTAVDHFYTVPPPEQQHAYIRALAAIAAAHHVTLFIPVSAPKGSVVDAMAALHMPKVCPFFFESQHTCFSPGLSLLVCITARHAHPRRQSRL